jgi:signal peptidase I
MLLSWYLFFGKNYQFIYNVGSSMVPTFQHKEWLVTQKKTSLQKGWVPEKNDIIIVSNGDEDLTKRVLALEGEYVRVKHGRIHVDDEKYKDPFTHQNITYWLEEEGERNKKPREEWLFLNLDMDIGVVPKGYVWVIGDNRHMSWMGFVKIEDIKALVIF